MKNNQKESVTTITNILSSLSDEYITDLFIIDYKIHLLKNFSPTKKNLYFENTINTHMQYHEDFDLQRIQSIKQLLREIIEYDEVIVFKGEMIYKELYKILFLIDNTLKAQKLLNNPGIGVW